MSTTTYSTLLLSRAQWDLCLDSSGNIALAAPPYSLSQDVASAVRLFLGELYYNTKKGIPYWSQVFGHAIPSALLKQLIVNAALTVPGVVTAQVIITAFSGRSVSGQIQYTDASGEVSSVGF